MHETVAVSPEVRDACLRIIRGLNKNADIADVGIATERLIRLQKSDLWFLIDPNEFLACMRNLESENLVMLVYARGHEGEYLYIREVIKTTSSQHEQRDPYEPPVLYDA